MINVKVVKKFAPFTIEVGCETIESALAMRETLLELTHLQGSKRSHLFARHLVGLIDSCLPSSEDDDECCSTFVDEVLHPHHDDEGDDLDYPSLDEEIETVIKQVLAEEDARKAYERKPFDRRGQELEGAEAEAMRKAKAEEKSIEQAYKEVGEHWQRSVGEWEPTTPCHEPPDEPRYVSKDHPNLLQHDSSGLTIALVDMEEKNPSDEGGPVVHRYRHI